MRIRIKELRDQKGLTLEQLAELAGLSVSYLSRMENSKRMINSKWIDRISTALDAKPHELFASGPAKRVIRLLTLDVKGSVRAGHWVEAMEWATDDQFQISVPAMPNVRKAFGLQVDGPSMNEVFADGAIAICVPIIEFWRELKTDDYVVCQRTRADGLVEGTIKQLVIDEDGRAWLWPRSKDPHHQAPISIPWPVDREGDGDIAEIAIHAVVAGVYQSTLG